MGKGRNDQSGTQQAPSPARLPPLVTEVLPSSTLISLKGDSRPSQLLLPACSRGVPPASAPAKCGHLGPVTWSSVDPDLPRLFQWEDPGFQRVPPQRPRPAPGIRLCRHSTVLHGSCFHKSVPPGRLPRPGMFITRVPINVCPLVPLLCGPRALETPGRVSGETPLSDTNAGLCSGLWEFRRDPCSPETQFLPG